MTFSISGGADAALFTITPAGALSFKTPPDFEAPADAGGDNVYNVDIAASDGKASTTLSLAVTVTNVIEHFASFSMKVFWNFHLPHIAILPIAVDNNGVQLLPSPSSSQQKIDWLQTSGTGNDDIYSNSPGIALAASPDVATTRYFYSMTIDAGALKVTRYTSDRANHFTMAAGFNNPVLIWQTAVPYTAPITAWMGFGADGFLYILLPDSADAANPGNLAQDPNSVFGKILRIDVSHDGFPADSTRNYAIPANNPFASGGGAPEVWALGVHEPRATAFEPDGSLFFVDSGVNREEVNLLPPGRPNLNFGWPIFDGTATNQSGALSNHTDPVAEYVHGASAGPIVTGFVYKGWISELKGMYLFADSTNDHVWGIPAANLALGKTLTMSSFRNLDEPFMPTFPARAYGGIGAMGYDGSGNIVINGKDGAVWLSKAQ